MKIALVSDSHGSLDRMKKLFSCLRAEGIKHVIHAGDFAVYGVEEIFAEYPDIEVYISPGNADVNREILDAVSALPHCHMGNVVQVTIEGVSFASSHVEGVAEGELGYNKVDVFVHGHTHRQKVVIRNGKIIVNPGALQENGSYLLMSLPEGKVQGRNIL